MSQLSSLGVTHFTVYYQSCKQSFTPVHAAIPELHEIKKATINSYNDPIFEVSSAWNALRYLGQIGEN